jgi:hypothetical protein
MLINSFGKYPVAMLICLVDNTTAHSPDLVRYYNHRIRDTARYFLFYVDGDQITATMLSQSKVFRVLGHHSVPR